MWFKEQVDRITGAVFERVVDRRGRQIAVLLRRYGVEIDKVPGISLGESDPSRKTLEFMKCVGGERQIAIMAKVLSTKELVDAFLEIMPGDFETTLEVFRVLARTELVNAKEFTNTLRRVEVAARGVLGTEYVDVDTKRMAFYLAMRLSVVANRRIDGHEISELFELVGSMAPEQQELVLKRVEWLSVKGDFDWGSLNLAEMGMGYWKTYPPYYFLHPRNATRMDRVLEQFAKSDGEWDARMMTWERLLLEAGYIVRETEYSRALVEKFVEDYGDGMRAKIEALDRAEKFKFVAGLRELDDNNGQQVRSAVIRSKSGHESTIFTEDQLKQICKLESRYYPPNSLGLTARVGYEIEFRDDQNLSLVNTLLRENALACVGMQHGEGGVKCMELSPGPFYSPKTGELIFELYNQRGVIDLYKSTNLTFHFNAEVTKKRGFEDLVWGLILTGWCYNQKQPFSSERLRVMPNRSIWGEYMEGKVFDVVTPHGFIDTFRHASLLASCLKQAQVVSRSTQLTAGKELAQIWHRYKHRLDKGVKYFGSRVGTPTSGRIDVGGPLLACLNTQISLVYPDLASRYDRDAVRRIRSGTTEIWVDGVSRWPSIVAFADEIVRHAGMEAQSVISRVVAAARYESGTIAAAGHDDRQVVKFLEKYHTPICQGSTQEDRRVAFDRVRRTLD